MIPSTNGTHVDLKMERTELTILFTQPVWCLLFRNPAVWLSQCREVIDFSASGSREARNLFLVKSLQAPREELRAICASRII